MEDSTPFLQALLDQGGEVRLPRPTEPWFCASSLVLKHPVRLIGQDFPDRPSIIFAPNVTGIIATPEAKFFSIEWLTIGSEGGTSGHGIVMQTGGSLTRVTVGGKPGRHLGFAEDGIHIEGWSKRDGTNANKWRLYDCLTRWNGGNGLHVAGSDANAGFAIGLDAEANGRYGILDTSFLNNGYFGPHLASNGNPGRGKNGSDQAALCTWRGQRFGPMPTATPEQLAAIPPDQSEHWRYVEDGEPSGIAPEWGTARFHAGGAAAIGVNINARDGAWDLYGEGNQAPVWAGGRSLVMGGNNDAKTIGRGLAMSGEHITQGSLEWRIRRSDGELIGLQLMPGADAGVVMRAWGPKTDRRGVEFILGDDLEVHRGGRKRWPSKEETT